MRVRPIVHALTITLVVSIGACVPDDVTDATEGKHPVVDPVLETLALSGDWEVAAHPVVLTDQALADHVLVEEIGELTQSALAEIAERDLAWYAADGERYETLYIHENGKAYGRRMARYSANRNPEETNNFGAFRGVGGSADDIFGDSAIGHNAAASGGFASGLGDVTQARISTNWQDDRRYRVSTGMTTYPTRVIGALSGSGNTQSGGCSGTKVGPRAVLTAAHCVMNSSGSISLSGRFNPGQTSTTTPNGSLSWSGVFLRDWRIHRRYDYAILYLADSPATVGLGWMGVVWWNGSSGYNGRSSKLFGYPCGANMACGDTTVQMCKASPRSDKRCDGWMYGHSRTLNSNSFRSDELLQYDNDMSSGQSGSAVWTWYGSSAAVMAVNTHSWSGVSMGPRFRQSMWNDVCSWIAHPSKQSAYATHSLCN
jgi:V8-like Glu-specific endopeptidase